MKEREQSSRRRFLKYAAAGVGAGVSWSALATPLSAKSDGRTRAARSASDVILFQGDSVTDAGRSREGAQPNAPAALGPGYAGISASQLLEEHPEARWKCYNRGVSGNKVYQLADRWQEDALALEPGILSILIGVNDFWHTLTGGYEGTVDVYERDYRALLDRTRKALPEVRLMIGEPYALKAGSAVDEAWYPKFEAYQAAAKRVADDYEAVWIPYQSVYDRALERAPATYWSADGVHPSAAGNALMAEAWLEGFAQLQQ